MKVHVNYFANIKKKTNESACLEKDTYKMLYKHEYLMMVHINC